MQGKTNGTDNYIEIDVLRIVKAICTRIWAVVLCGIIASGAALGLTVALVPATYKADTLLYVNNTSISVSNSSLNISSASLSAAQQLVSTYIVILKSRSTLNEVIDYAGVNLNVGALKEMISAGAVDGTEIFKIEVTAESPAMAETLANSIAKILPRRIAEIVAGSSVRVVDYAVTPVKRSGPDYKQNTLIGMFVGILVCCVVIAAAQIFDNTVYDETYLAEVYNIPVLASIPEIGSKSGASHYGKSSDYHKEVKV